MKKFHLYITIVVAMTSGASLSSGCASVDQTAVVLHARAPIPSSKQIKKLEGTLDFGDFNKVDLAQSSAFKGRSLKKSQIDRTTVESFWLEVVDPANGQDLAFLHSVSFFVSAPGLKRVLVGKGGPFSAGKKYALVSASKTDLTPWATADSMTFSADVIGVPPPQETIIKAEVRLIVDVNVEGLLTP